MRVLLSTLFFLILGIGLSYSGPSTGPPDTGEKFNYVNIQDFFHPAACILHQGDFSSVELITHHWEFTPVYAEVYRQSRTDKMTLGKARLSYVNFRAPRDGLSYNREETYKR